MSRKNEKGKVGKGSEMNTDSVSEPGSIQTLEHKQLEDCGESVGQEVHLLQHDIKTQP